MCANIKVKYVGSNPAFTFDKVYQVLAVSGTSVVIMSDDAGFLATFPLSDPDIELVSVTAPDQVQLYP
jgi:hypothetical protein